MADKPNSTPITSFTTNSYSEHPMGVIGMAMAVGMGLMFLTIFLGAPILISMAALLGGILLVYGYKIGKTEYAIYPEGISQSIELYIPKMLGKRSAKNRFYKWSDIRSYKHDEDFKRSLESYEYIKLYVRKAPNQIWISNEKNKEGFEAFRDVFLEMVEKDDQAHIVQKGKKTVSDPVDALESNNTHDTGQAQLSAQESRSMHENADRSKTKHIRKRKSFYKTFFAKVLTIFFLALIVAFISYGIINGMRAGNWFRVLLIMLPGTAYMFYRSFVKKQ